MPKDRDLAIEEFRDVMFKWSKENGKILNKEEVKLFGAGYFAGLRRIEEHITEAAKGEKDD